MKNAKTLDFLFVTMTMVKDRPWLQHDILTFFSLLHESIIFFTLRKINFPTDIVYYEFMKRPEIIDLVFNLLEKSRYSDMSSILKILKILKRNDSIKQRLRNHSETIVHLCRRYDITTNELLYEFVYPIARKIMGPHRASQKSRALGPEIESHWNIKKEWRWSKSLQEKINEPFVNKIKKNRVRNEENLLEYRNAKNSLKRVQRKVRKASKAYLPTL